MHFFISWPAGLTGCLPAAMHLCACILCNTSTCFCDQLGPCMLHGSNTRGTLPCTGLVDENETTSSATYTIMLRRHHNKCQHNTEGISAQHVSMCACISAGLSPAMNTSVRYFLSQPPACRLPHLAHFVTAATTWLTQSEKPNVQHAWRTWHPCNNPAALSKLPDPQHLLRQFYSPLPLCTTCCQIMQIQRNVHPINKLLMGDV